jgi:CHAD domain-containing protein
VQRNSKPSRVAAKSSRNGASGEPAQDPRATKLTTKLAELAHKMPGSMSEDEVHKLRTTVRRVEVVLQSGKRRRKSKLDAQLKKLRKRAGTVRDFDVHLGMLKELDTAQQHACRELHTYLETKRAKQARKLEKIIEAEVDDGLEKRLKRAAAVVHQETPDSTRGEERLAAVRKRYLAMTTEIPEDGAALHRLRIDCKRLRYEVEALAPEEDAKAANAVEAHAAELVEQLKGVQDEIGVWHDWLTLYEAALKHLHGPHAAALLALLRTRTATHYHNARRLVAEVRSQLQGVIVFKKPTEAIARRSPSQSLAV